jgi:hypothetical protein
VCGSSRSHGSVRGAVSDDRPYRDRELKDGAITSRTALGGATMVVSPSPIMPRPVHLKQFLGLRLFDDGRCDRPGVIGPANDKPGIVRISAMGKIKKRNYADL